MANKLPSLVVFIILLAFQEMVVLQGEAASCQTDSRLFRGACFSYKNCASVCKNEGFNTGKCKFFKCVCFKECASQTPDQGPPEEEQPGEGPPNDEQPGEGPPNDEQPVEGPPDEEQPGEGPPNEEQPGEGPPNEEQPSEGPPEE